MRHRAVTLDLIIPRNELDNLSSRVSSGFPPSQLTKFSMLGINMQNCSTPAPRLPLLSLPQPPPQPFRRVTHLAGAFLRSFDGARPRHIHRSYVVSLAHNALRTAVVTYMRLMKRVRALLVLGTLLVTPIGIPVAFAFSPCDCCKTATICAPRNDQSRKQNLPCDGFGHSQQTCMCAPAQHTQPAILSFAPKATIGAGAVLLPPVVVLELSVFSLGPPLSRFHSPPKQPPRP
jgi:hypothetical protein